MSVSELKQHIQQLIARGKTETAIQTLTTHFQNSERLHQIILKSAKYHRLKKGIINGTIQANDAEIALNKLNINILDFITDVEEKDLSLDPLLNDKTYKQDLKLSLARIQLAEFLLNYKKPKDDLSITAICKKANIKSRKYVVLALDEFEQYQLINRKKSNKKTYWELNEKGKIFLHSILKDK